MALLTKQWLAVMGIAVISALLISNGIPLVQDALNYGIELENTMNAGKHR